MKKNRIIFIVLLVVSILLMLYGFIYFSVSSIPFQDASLAPSSALIKQQVDIVIGIVMMIAGAGLLIGDIIWKKKSSKKSKK